MNAPPRNHRIDAHLLRYFLAVAEHGSITRAAESLYLAQSSLSQAIRGLERRVNATLFDRSVHPLPLTPAGRRFEQIARSLLADLDTARNAVKSVQTLRSGRLRITTPAAFSVDPVVGLIARFNTRHPDVLLDLITVESTDSAIDSIRRGTAEVAIGHRRTCTNGLTMTPLPTHEIILAALPHLLESLPKPLPHAMISKVPLILDTGDHSNEALFHDSGLSERQPDVRARCTNPRALWGLVSRGSGAALLPQHVADKYVTGVETVSLDPPLFRTPALFTRSEHPSASAAEFVRLARQIDSEEGSP